MCECFKNNRVVQTHPPMVTTVIGRPSEAPQSAVLAPFHVMTLRRPCQSGRVAIPATPQGSSDWSSLGRELWGLGLGLPAGD